MSERDIGEWIPHGTIDRARGVGIFMKSRVGEPRGLVAVVLAGPFLNVRLIAAAPRIFALLKEIVFRANLCPEDQWIEDRALEVIAEVRGKSE